MITASIIPESFFVESLNQSELLLWLFMVVAIGMLAFGADKAVAAAARLAATAGLSKVVIGATIVSLGTTTPEAVVSVRAAWAGAPGLALGNGVGSIIFDTGVIFGLGCLLTRLPIDRFLLNRQGWVQFGSGLLLTVTCLVLLLVGGMNNVVLPRAFGLVLLVLLGGYMIISVRWSRQHPELIPDEAQVEAAVSHRGLAALVSISMILLGLALVVAGAELLVGSAKVLAARYGVPEEVIAVTIVAFGTSLPELVTGLMSIIRGHSELLVGNIIGADVLNVLFVVGAAAVAKPIKVDPNFFYIYLPAMMILLGMMRVFIFVSGNRFKRWMGIPLLAVYAAFVVLTIAMGVEMP
jgi:cation:H+ antiporter